MDKNTTRHSTTNPGVPVFPGKNTPFIKIEKPRVIPAPGSPNAQPPAPVAPAAPPKPTQ